MLPAQTLKKTEFLSKKTYLIFYYSGVTSVERKRRIATFINTKSRNSANTIPSQAHSVEPVARN
tara:strand:+ start:191 stop:382 length:192 start_codon:yes stop_codon:yes gene_type:complete